MDTKRLSHLLGMLGSAHDGEVLNAAKLAHRLVREAKATWPELFAGKPPTAPTYDDGYRHGFTAGYQKAVAEAAHEMREAYSYPDIVRELLSGDYDLTDWEAQFVESVHRRGAGRLSERQKAVLDRMRDKYAL